MNPRVRTFLVCAAALLAVWVVTGALIPSAGTGRRGAPAPIVFLGVVHGLVGGLTAAGIVLVYRSVRVLNFAQTAIGGAGLVVAVNITVLTPVPFPVALVLGLVVSAVVGLAFELVFVRRFLHAPRLVLTVFTIVAATFLAGPVADAFDHLPIFPDPATRSAAQLSGLLDPSPHLPFRSFRFTLPGSPAPFGFPHLLAIAMVVVALGALGVFLRYSRLGVAVRALAENAERASLLGIGVGFVSSVVWTISGVLSGVSSTMKGLIAGPGAALGFAPDLFVVALAAAVLARMRSIPVAVAASVGIEVFVRGVTFLQPDLVGLSSGVLLLIVAGGLLLQRSRGERSEAAATSSWAATEEIHPVPRELASLGPIRVARWSLAAVIGAALIVYPFVVSPGAAYRGSVIAIQAIVGLSLVVLTGWTGQVSLGQFGLAAIGALACGALAGSLPFVLVLPLAAAVSAGVAVLVGLPALRLPGLHLAAATLAFAAAVRGVLFNERLFGWLLPDGGVSRPSMPFVDFEDERSMYFLSLAALALVLLALRNVRTSRFGRIWIGLRDNEANAASAGISPLRLKLTAFGVAGGLAGFAGALLAYQQRTVSADGFTALQSIDAFTIAVIGGIGSLAGPLLGSLAINGTQTALAGAPEIALALTPSIAIVLLYVAPGGLVSVLAAMRDSVLRIVAQRNRLVVPSLFSDIDPDALRKRLVPIAPAHLPATLHRRYDRASVHADTREAAGSGRDAAALDAAAKAVTS